MRRRHYHRGRGPYVREGEPFFTWGFLAALLGVGIGSATLGQVWHGRFDGLTLGLGALSVALVWWGGLRELHR